MSWRPQTDFEEEIVNLQPDHDFIFGSLCQQEPQPFYPRPQSHIDYAATKRRQARADQVEFEDTGKMNNRLHAICEVQRIAQTKPLGELPSINDWDNDANVETEMVAMMRYFGMGPSVEQPLNPNVTIASFPIKNGVEVMDNGLRKVPLLFDTNLFKLKPKAATASSDSSSATPSPTSSSAAYESATNSSFPSDESNPYEESFETATSLGLQYDPDMTVDYDRICADRQTLLLQAARLEQYDKLHEDSADDEFSFTSGSSKPLQSFSYERASFSSANTTTSNWDMNDTGFSADCNDFPVLTAAAKHGRSSRNSSISSSSVVTNTTNGSNSKFLNATNGSNSNISTTTNGSSSKFSTTTNESRSKLPTTTNGSKSKFPTTTNGSSSKILNTTYSIASPTPPPPGLKPSSFLARFITCENEESNTPALENQPPINPLSGSVYKDRLAARRESLLQKATDVSESPFSYANVAKVPSTAKPAATVPSSSNGLNFSTLSKQNPTIFFHSPREAYAKSRIKAKFYIPK